MAPATGGPVDAPGPVAPLPQAERPAVMERPRQVPQNIMEVELETEEGSSRRKATVARGGEDVLARAEVALHGRVTGPPLQMEVAKNTPPAAINISKKAYLPDARVPVGGRRRPCFGADGRPGADTRLPLPPHRPTPFRVRLVGQGRVTVLEEGQKPARRETGRTPVHGPRKARGGFG